IKALQPAIEKIKAIQNISDLARTSGELLKEDIGGLLQISIHPDLGNSKVYSLYLEPGMLGLPEREYYLDEDEKTQHIRSHYTKYIDLLLQESLITGLSGSAHSILSFETSLASHMMPKEDRRDIAKIYNPVAAAELKTKYPDLNWDDFFHALGIPTPEQVIITDPAYLEFIISAIQSTDLEAIKRYLLFILIHQAAPFSHHALEQAHFEMFAKTIEGIQKLKPRNERIVKVINGILGEALGELFVSNYFPPKAKDAAIEMVQDIVTAYTNRISQLDWMGEDTKKYAIQKLASIRAKIGYPDVWKDYSGLEINSEVNKGSYLANMLAAAKWKRAKDLARIAQPVDRDEWFMAPQVVNAYYNPLFNEIVFPAAILQPPFFDWEADAAVNYGGIGAVIGHEITHGFDDQGSRFDKEGNYNEWWTANDRAQFEIKTKKLIDQFDAYRPFDDLALNGTFTLGENIADLGGLCVAYDALQLYYARHGRPGPIDNLSPEQRFFMSWATVWRIKTRPEAMRNQIKTDPHPPGMYRAIAAPSNMVSFYNAFRVTEQSPWFRKEEDRIAIW
ncbi:MAG TPA: M13 family metallopeptidase, partial [Saprospiraceae bacterium]|nr:M13 family metallopeptidase [Saprospiraceae bacterium]